MYYLVCYQLETAVAVDDDVDLQDLTKNCTAELAQFIKRVGNYPVIRIDKKYPSYSAIIDNFYIIKNHSRKIH
ncbi:hypothetical protein GCM10023231_21310 [Olivibacter ginsenosidimutans]|uniref:Uncharacterized protein n=1 Tax=Olivibacter ginsenosidimutans TaxID=1176537 RepID=A0ABP9BAH3_9SPHI